ncbi:class I SAM-dependent RNA methyltransferase [Candidatus Saccharibacteria bacterium]|nr:class I SAM-dependent RNA methyltransferase [Candidatus Saccharibacteria bacterium]
MEVKVDKFIPGGFALGTAKNGKKCFFWNALPGETVVNFETTKEKSSYLEAVALEVKDPSPFRNEPKNACFLSTSPWQILDFEYELQQKAALVVEMFREHGINIKTPEIVTDGKEYFYRNKMEYALYYDYGDEKIHPAFHARGSHKKLPITSSSLERPEIFKKALGIIDDLNARHEEARKYQTLLLRCNQNGEVSGGLFENHKPHPVFKNLEDKILGKTYSYSPNGFFQINLPVYELALLEIKKHITTGEVLDLYAGVGTIGLSVAGDKHLTLVEVDKSAFAELQRNCGNLATPILAKSEEVPEFIKSDQTVIVDPPRAGLSPSLVEHFTNVTPETIIYLSCNPITQARDVAILLEKYEILKVKTFNFFPHTPHIENLVVLKRK